MGQVWFEAEARLTSQIQFSVLAEVESSEGTRSVPGGAKRDGWGWKIDPQAPWVMESGRALVMTGSCEGETRAAMR